MDWNQLRAQWQRDSAAPSTPDTIASVQRRDDELRRTLRRRDLLESVVGLLIAPVFGAMTWGAALREAWLPALFSALLAAWALYVPWHLWRNRRRLPQPSPTVPLLDHLRASHAAMLLQARQLEQIWRWYLAPCAIGVIGLTFSVRGATTGAFVYSAVVLGFCLLIARANHYAARTQFRVHADALAKQISALTEENHR